MPKKIYIGNLPPATTEQEVKDLFSAFGRILTTTLETDRRGTTTSAFLDMDDAEADKAIRALNGAQYDGRSLNVNEVRPH